MIRPCPDICNAEGVCGCDLISAATSIQEKRTTSITPLCPGLCDGEGECLCYSSPTPTLSDATTFTMLVTTSTHAPTVTTRTAAATASSSPKHLKVSAQPGRVKPCPQIRNGQGICGCATFNETNSSYPNAANNAKLGPFDQKLPGKAVPCPLICSKGGCVCDAFTVAANAAFKVEQKNPGRVIACPQICNAKGQCVCDTSSGTSSAAPSATPMAKMAREVPVEVDVLGRVRPCPQICNAQGVCVCASLSNANATTATSARSAIKKAREEASVGEELDSERVKPCPQICNAQGVCICAA